MPVGGGPSSGDGTVLDADGPAVEPRHEVPRPVTVSAPRADAPDELRGAAGAGAAAAVTGVVAPTTGRPVPDDELDAPLAARRRPGRVRARKVRRIVRHVDPWSVLKISVLFYAALFAIVCVASALLWSAARTAGTVEDVESFITSVGGFGNCEPIDGESPVTTTTAPGAPAGPVDQIDPAGSDTTVPAPGETEVVDPGDDEDCREGEELVGEFKFEDDRIFQAFILGGIVLVLAGAAANVVLALLFNLMSDLTGGVRVTVLEEDPPPRRRPARTGSPGPEPRG